MIPMSMFTFPPDKAHRYLRPLHLVLAVTGPEEQEERRVPLWSRARAPKTSGFGDTDDQVLHPGSGRRVRAYVPRSARPISRFDGKLGSRTFRALSTPATGKVPDSSRPTWTSDEPVLADGPRQGDQLRVRGHLRDEAPGVELPQLVPAHAPGQHRHVVDVGVLGHGGEGGLGVPAGEL